MSQPLVILDLPTLWNPTLIYTLTFRLQGGECQDCRLSLKKGARQHYSLVNWLVPIQQQIIIYHLYINPTIAVLAAKLSANSFIKHWYRANDLMIPGTRVGVGP